SQAEIDRRHDQIYGSILHSRTLDIGFVRAIFRSVSYNPEARYPSALEMEKDLSEAAPPIGRRRPAELDLGLARHLRPPEAILTLFNVGGGTLSGEVSTDVEWLEVGVSGAGTGRAQPFQANRQAVRVVAFPERMRPGASAEGRVVVQCPPEPLVTTVRVARGADGTTLGPDPAKLRV